MKLSTKLWGPESPKATIILLHGMGGTGALWRPIAAHLEETYRVIAPDQRGHGGSQKLATPGLTPQDYGQDVLDTLREILPETAGVWIVGHSMGVRTACAVAHLQPSLVKGLVLVDLGFSGLAGGGLGPALADFLAKMPSFFSSRNEAREYFKIHCPDPSIAQYLFAVSQPQDGGVGFPFDVETLVGTIRAAESSSLRPWIQEFGARQLPVLILRGETSRVWTAAEFAAEQAGLTAYPSLIFEEFAGTGHGLPFEKRAEFIDRVKRFVETSS